MNYLMTKVEMPLIPVIAELEKNGYLIDCGFFTALRDYLEPEQADILAKIQEIAGLEFNPNSSKQIAKLLYEALSLPIPKKTEKGSPSTDEESLTLLSNENQVVHKILQYKKIAKLLSTYCKFPLEVDYDLRLRPKYNQMGTVTGRLTATNKIQTLPKEDGYGIRNGFIAPPGFKIVAADFDQQELFVLASVSGDQAMLEAISSGVDLHGLAAKKIFDLDCEPNEVKRLHTKKRNQIKAIQFGIIYGRSALSLAKELSLTLEEAEGLVKAYFKSFPKVEAFIENSHIFAKRNGYIVDVFGRSRVLPDAQRTGRSEFGLLNASLREAQNFPIQAAAATVTKLAMIQCHNHIREFHPQIKMILSLHDELQFQVPDDEVEHFASELPALMTNLGVEGFGFKIPFKVSVTFGQSWGSLVAHQSASLESAQ